MAPLPLRPSLRPGLHVVRRDDRHLQVGIDPPRRVVLPDDPDVRRLLDDLGAARRPQSLTERTRRLLDDLVTADLLVDADADPRGARARASVLVDAPGELRDLLGRLLEGSGCGVAAPGEAADVAVVIAAGELRRGAVDGLVRSDVPHLVASTHPDGFRVGPFVVPGRTACLRCVDAHLGELDPRRALVLEQLAGREAARRPDPATQAMLAGWVVRDVLAFLDGVEPSTWSATVDVDASAPVRRAWLRHPHCGCTWADVGWRDADL